MASRENFKGSAVCVCVFVCVSMHVHVYVHVYTCVCEVEGGKYLSTDRCNRSLQALPFLHDFICALCLLHLMNKFHNNFRKHSQLIKCRCIQPVSFYKYNFPIDVRLL